MLVPPPPESPPLKLDQEPLLSARIASWGPAFAMKMICSHSAARVRGRKLHPSLPKASLNAWPVEGVLKTCSTSPTPCAAPRGGPAPCTRLQLTWPRTQGPHCVAAQTGQGMLWRAGHGLGPGELETQTEPSVRRDHGGRADNVPIQEPGYQRNQTPRHHDLGSAGRSFGGDQGVKDGSDHRSPHRALKAPPVHTLAST